MIRKNESSAPVRYRLLVTPLISAWEWREGACTVGSLCRRQKMEGKDKRMERLIKHARIAITTLEPPLMALQVSSTELWIHLRSIPQTFRNPNFPNPPNSVFLVNAARNRRGAPSQTCSPPGPATSQARPPRPPALPLAVTQDGLLQPPGSERAAALL